MRFLAKRGGLLQHRMDACTCEAHHALAVVDGHDVIQPEHVDDDRRPIDAHLARHRPASQTRVRALRDDACIRVHTRLKRFERLAQRAWLDHHKRLSAPHARPALLDAALDVQRAHDGRELIRQRLLRRSERSGLAARPPTHRQLTPLLLLVGAAKRISNGHRAAGVSSECRAPREGRRHHAPPHGVATPSVARKPTCPHEGRRDRVWTLHFG